ncbi:MULTISPECIES: terminase gpA endonuclease subunit [Methylosinus]|uniref:Terminase n=1 Tax=Methylosinus trichosporium (strain ATCC 35070 / NCIMB 11131 / UNIQEM 75 / OB3b) TaxID=595536 RepID=A0A2D2CYI5_METT3|nr:MULTISPECIES: terminase gpA endonuclease subunit [Methylosinus]ATQ67808.1 terminase [Methylosinus trichosporium OB3b]
MMDLGAVAATLDALALRVEPIDPQPLSQWMAENIVLVDGPSAGRMWSLDGAPYLAEIADCLGDDHPCNLVTVRKSQQTGASILALGWCLYIADREPANTLYGVPGIDALRDLNSGKLQPLIDAWQKHTGRVVFEPQTSRSGAGSTTYEKVFSRGRLWLGNANSVMDLSSKTVKKGVKDEVSKWEDIPGKGDPETLFFGRFTSFRRRRNWKILEISTPEVDSGDEAGEAHGHCRIDRSFKKSDQRFWFVPCPGCGAHFAHEWGGFVVDEAHPHKSYYVCPHCGARIDDLARVPMIRSGCWRPTAAGGARHPGFHIDAFVSLMMSYEAIAEDHIASRKGGEIGRKDFANLVLGLPHQFKGDAPDHKRLMERREDGLARGHVPPQGLLRVASADVQMRGIWVEVLSVAPNRQSWVVDALYLDGSTESPEGEAFEKLEQQVLNREFTDAFGRGCKIDALAVDSGYRTHVVYAWVRAKQRLHPDTGQDMVLAVDGRDGWSKPAIGMPTPVDIDLAGTKIRQGVKLWPVGTWPLKGAFYADLHKLGVKSGAAADPDGYCHFGTWLDETYFKQITAEYLATESFRGRTRRVWKPITAGADNHLLDCRIYNLALAEYLGLSSTTADEWAELARRRGMPQEAIAEGLFAPRRDAAPAPAGAPIIVPAPAAAPEPEARDPFARLAALNDS